jgi:RHS repeat-associated protein
MSYADYFPFGWQMPGRNQQGDYRYAYQGQEKDPETGWEAFELRMYDGRVGRWMTTDPYSQYHSPYLAMGNNPINLVDPDGGFTASPLGDYYMIVGGQRMLLGNDGINDGKVYVLKTTLTQNQMYSESNDLNNATPAQRGQIDNISPETAMAASFYVSINSGTDISNKSTVTDNFVEIVGDNNMRTTMLQNMQNTTTSVGNTGIEGASFGYNIYDGSTKLLPANLVLQGKPVTLNTGQNAVTNYPISGFPNDFTRLAFSYHGHPSTTLTVNGTTIGFAQPPSAVDINNRTKMTLNNRYVFGMRSKMVYVYSNKGTSAVIPFSLWGNF